MRHLIKYSLWLLILAAGSQVGFSFALLGRLGAGLDGGWQTADIGFGNKGGIGAPKNWGEGYRLNTPVVFYSYDATFMSFFGTNAGPAAIDAAFAMVNNITNLSTYSPSLSEFPLESKQNNYLAANLGLVDLKSLALESIVTWMGLEDPELYVFTLHNRYHDGNAPACPAGMQYAVVQRNFDPSSTDLNTVYSPYINDVLFTYQILEFCDAPGTPPNTVLVNSPVDPFADGYSSVASFGLNIGQYYTGLTRDDIAGLRTLMIPGNIVKEDAPFNSFQIVSNTLSEQFLSTTNYGGFLSSLLTNDPNTLLTLYPGLQINGTATNLVAVTSTNVFLFFTNQSVLPIFSNTIPGGLVTGLYFTNQPGPTILNYDADNSIVLQTLDYGLFVDQAATNPPAILQALYPGLVIVSSHPKITFGSVTNYISYLTNQTSAPYPGVPSLVTIPVSTNYNVPLTNYTYIFGNVVVNHSYPNRLVITQSISSTNLSYGSTYPPVPSLKTNLSIIYVPKISGDFFLIPTNWCGFDVTAVARLNNPPYQFSQTNTVIYPGYSAAGSITNTVPATNVVGLLQYSFYVYTNYSYVVNPGICEPTLAVGTNFSTNVVAEYNYSFGNIVTNTYSTNTYVTVIVTNITPVIGGIAGEMQTNVFENGIPVTNGVITLSPVLTNLPSGDFFIEPSNWCGFNIVSTFYTNTVYVTNTFVVANTFSNSGFYSETIISQYTNRTYKVQPYTCATLPGVAESRLGVDHVQFIRANYDSELGQNFVPFTNIFVLYKETNNTVIPEVFYRVLTAPDFLVNASDMVGVDSGGVFDPIETNTISFDINNILPNEGGPGLVNVGSGSFFGLNKGNAFFNNSAVLDGSPFFENSTLNAYYGSFDGTTNAPTVYPETTSLANLENQLLLRISPSVLPDGTNNVPYSVALSAVGGLAPYTFSLDSSSALPAGLTLTPAGVLAGTVALAGTYDFMLQLSDNGGRTVQYDYSITIH